MAYASASDVAGYTPNLVSPASTFDSSTSPALAQVNNWLSAGCAVINTRLAGAGYAAIPATSGVYDIARDANALYAAWRAERSRINTRVSADERTRADMFKRDFEFLLDELTNQDLSRSGVTATSVAYAGGISVADKLSVESDGDRVMPRFSRGQFSNPRALTPSGDTSGCSGGY